MRTIGNVLDYADRKRRKRIGKNPTNWQVYLLQLSIISALAPSKATAPHQTRSETCRE